MENVAHLFLVVQNASQEAKAGINSKGPQRSGPDRQEGYWPRLKTACFSILQSIMIHNISVCHSHICGNSYLCNCFSYNCAAGSDRHSGYWSNVDGLKSKGAFLGRAEFGGGALGLDVGGTTQAVMTTPPTQGS